MATSNARRIYGYKRSCLTNRIVWVAFAPSYKGQWAAYKRACDREIERVEHWDEYVAERRAEVMALVNDIQAKYPPATMTPECKAVVRKLRAMAKKAPVCDMEFYNHIVEERRRREEDRRIRRQMRERAEKEKSEKLKS